MKIKGKLIFGFCAVLIVTGVMGAVGFLGMRQLSGYGAAVAGSNMRGIEYVRGAESCLFQMGAESRNAILGSLLDDGKAASGSRDAFELHAESFALYVGKAREIAASEEPPREELLVFYDRTIELFEAGYLPKARESIEAAISDIPEHRHKLYINARLAAADADAEQILSLLQGAVDVNLALTEQAGLDSIWLMQTFSVILVSLLGLALVLAVTVSILTIRSIAKSLRRPVGAAKMAPGRTGGTVRTGATTAAAAAAGKTQAGSERRTALPIDDFDDGGRFIAPDARVLVVDDVHADLKAAQVVMRPYNIKVDLVNSGVAAIQALQFGRYDMVFIDYRMPGMDGAETARRIRMMEKTELPLIALTDDAATDFIETYLEHGFNDYLSKPINTVILDALLRKWIPRSKRRPV